MDISKLKYIVNKKAIETDAPHQSIYDMYFFEHFLYRISISKYAKNFVFKGGFLLESMLGLYFRTTVDLDLKVQKIELSEEELKEIFTEICNINCDDIRYSIISLDSIQLNNVYNGQSLNIEAQMKHLKKRFSVDIGVGDVVTPYPINYLYESKIDNLKFDILSYPKETIIAEKFQILISRGLDNSRAKDLYDIHMLLKEDINKEIFSSALINTFHYRETTLDKPYLFYMINEIHQSEHRREIFEHYARKNSFVRNITFDDVMLSANRVCDYISNQEKINLSEYNVELHLVRHGQDEQDKLGGWSGNHLTNDGIKEVEVLSVEVAESYDVFISSDLVRAKETSFILNKRLNMEITYNEAFREMNNGDLANLSKEEAQKKYPGLYFSSLKMDEHYPNGESPNEFFSRVQKAFLDMLENNRNKRILLVTHGGVITVILCLIHGYVYSNQLKITPKTASLTILK